MSLRIRLTLSYLGMVVLFVLVFLLASRVIWPHYGPGREIDRFPYEVEAVLKEELSFEETEERLGQLPFLRGAQFELLTLEEAREQRGIVAKAVRGRFAVRSNKGPGFRLAGPVYRSQELVGVLSINLLPPRGPGPPPGPPPGGPPHELRVGQLMFSEFFRSVLFGVASAALVCFGVGLLLSDRLSKPVGALVKATRELTPNDLTARVSTQGPAELGALAESFNEMAAGLQKALRQAEEERDKALRSEASRREFLADVSHNLRTPLTAAQGWLDALLEGLVVGEEEEYLKRTQREILYVSKTVQRLLDLSRWEGIIPAFAQVPIDFNEVLMEVVESLEESAVTKNIELSLSEVEPSVKVLGDRLRVRELLQILLENAVEHGGESFTLSVSARRQEERLEISIADTGKGFPEGDLDLLTERYRSPGGGVGLGLAIADKVVEAADGKLELRRRRSGGAEVRFSLPLAQTV